MKFYLRIKGKRIWQACALAVLGIALACCGEKITAVDQPAAATVGETVAITVHIDIPTVGDGGPDNLIFGFLVPKGWKAAQNTTITYTSETLGNGVMTLIPNTTLAKNGDGLNWPDDMKKTFKIGANLIDDMEWVAYQSDKAFKHNGSEITGELHISIKVGADNNNTSVKLGYVITDSGNGFTSDGNGTYFSVVLTNTCFEVTGGTGDLVDFCNPQLTTINPPKSLDNDYITLTFDGTVTDTDLKDANAVYLCATAYTSDGQTISVCEQTDKTKMVQRPDGSKKYQITLWPKAFFGASDTQTIVRMEYFITNQAGTKKVGYGNTDSPFLYSFKCS